MVEKINGVKVKKLKALFDDRGHLMEILREDDSIFEKFGQVYITTAKPGIVKAWHYHKNQTDNFTCVYGEICLALYDSRSKSSTFGKVNEFILSIDEPALVQIPALVYHGFKCSSKDEAIVVNTPTKAYDHKQPDEFRVDPYDNNIPYDWKSK